MLSRNSVMVKVSLDSVISIVVPRSHIVCFFNIDLPEEVIVRIACSGASLHAG